MTNKEIIKKAKVLNNIDEECHTFVVWKQLGYKVKKGEHAAFSTNIWKYSNKKKHNDDEDTEETSNGKCFMTKAYFFKRSQVEEV